MSEPRVFWTGVVLLCSCVFALVGRDLQTPGLYYDEVIQATPASEFLREGGEPLQIPGARNRWQFGGWFPLMTQPYMGALKSQLLIPTFALFGATPESLRITTLAWGCLGLVLVMLWVRALFGSGVALACGALLAFDPSFLFVARHDWGSVSLALVCRGGGLWLLTLGWRVESPVRLAAGGLLLGLGLFNKIDFAPFLAGAGLAFLLAAPRSFWGTLRGRGGLVGAALGGLALGALPMALTLSSLLGATRAVADSAGLRGTDFAEKLAAWSTFLDGSHFHRLMLAGGSFERLMQVDGAAAGPFLWILAASCAGLAAVAVREARHSRLDRRELFVLLATLLTFGGLLATPRAARIHHVMNLQPFPQLLVALCAARLWSARPRSLPSWAPRVLAAATVAAALVGSLRIDLAVLALFEETGGRGRWSRALGEFARELPPDGAVVSLDWGFHAPLRFLRPELELQEPVWRMFAARPPGPGFAMAGEPGHVYLLQAPGYEVFPMGAALVEAVAQLPMGAAQVVEHHDAAGAPAFRSIHFARPHDLVYRGTFEVRLR